MLLERTQSYNGQWFSWIQPVKKALKSNAKPASKFEDEDDSDDDDDADDDEDVKVMCISPSFMNSQLLLQLK